jgi:hypothetical protein
MPYTDFTTDEHLTNCISNLYNSYLKAKNEISKKKFYSNKVDTFKLTFDAKFNNLSEEELVEFEIKRQIDKSINNAIGTFHEDILGRINGYEKGNLDGYDIKASDNSLFADIKNKHNTMNSSSSEALYQKLQRFAEKYPDSKCYWVQIWAKSSFCEQWQVSFGKRNYNHPNVYKISGDQFYALLSGQENALFQLYKTLPKAIEDFLNSLENDEKQNTSTALAEIQESETARSILEQITFDNFSYYLGFKDL